MARSEPVIEWRYPDLPSPSTDQEMLDLLENEKEIRLKWITGTQADGWETFQIIDGVHIEQLAIPESTIHVVRANGILKNIDLDLMFHSTTHGGLEERQKINSEIIDHRIVYKVGGSEVTYISYSAFATPVGVTNREFLGLRTVEDLPGGGKLIVVQSINYEACPFTPSFVRGTLRSGRLFEPLENGDWKMTIVDHVDPRGRVPGFVVNMFKRKAAEAFTKIQNTYGKAVVNSPVETN